MKKAPAVTRAKSQYQQSKSMVEKRTIYTTQSYKIYRLHQELKIFLSLVCPSSAGSK